MQRPPTASGVSCGKSPGDVAGDCGRSFTSNPRTIKDEVASYDPEDFWSPARLATARSLADRTAAQANGTVPRKPASSDHGVLECLTQICNVFGVGENFSSSTNIYMDHGWPELQIDVLYECIRVAEAVPGTLLLSPHFNHVTLSH